MEDWKTEDVWEVQNATHTHSEVYVHTFKILVPVNIVKSFYLHEPCYAVSLNSLCFAVILSFLHVTELIVLSIIFLCGLDPQHYNHSPFNLYSWIYSQFCL